MQTQTNRPAELVPPLDLAAMVRVSEACKRAAKMRAISDLRMLNARIRLANLRRDGGAK